MKCRLLLLASSAVVASKLGSATTQPLTLHFLMSRKASDDRYGL